MDGEVGFWGESAGGDRGGVEAVGDATHGFWGLGLVSLILGVWFLSSPLQVRMGCWWVNGV